MLFKKEDKVEKKSVQKSSEVMQLELQLLTTMDQMDNYRKLSFQYQQDYNNLAKSCKNFCMILLDKEYAKYQLEGINPIDDMGIFDLLAYTIKKYNEAKKEDRDLILNLTEQLKFKSSQIESLKTQMSVLIISGGGEVPKETLEQINKMNIEKPTENKNNFSTTTNTSNTTRSIPQNKGIAKLLSLSSENHIEKGVAIPQPNSPKKNLASKQVNEGNTLSIPTMPTCIPNSTETPTSNLINDVEGNSSNNGDVSNEIKAINTLKENVEKNSKNTDVLAHIIDLNDFMRNIDTNMWSIIRAIGEFGMSEANDIKDYLLKNEIAENGFNVAINTLKKMKIVKQEKILTGYRWFFVYEFTDVGTRIYLENFKSNPIECEKNRLIREHDTAMHGYCIKDTASILIKELGYSSAETSRKTNTIAIENSTNKYIPDIIATMDGKIKDYFEVELGHHTQKDFNEKCDKMKMVTKNLYFVVPSEDVKNKVLDRQIKLWIESKGGYESLKGTTVYLTTIKKLASKKWDNIYSSN